MRPPSLILLITTSQDRWIFPSQSWGVRNSMMITKVMMMMMMIIIIIIMMMMIIIIIIQVQGWGLVPCSGSISSPEVLWVVALGFVSHMVHIPNKVWQSVCPSKIKCKVKAKVRLQSVTSVSERGTKFNGTTVERAARPMTIQSKIKERLQNIFVYKIAWRQW